MKYACDTDTRIMRDGTRIPLIKPVVERVYRDGKFYDVALEDPERFIRLEYSRRFRPNDFDYCGNERIVFKFDNGECWLLEHSWWATHEDDGWTPNYESSVVKLAPDSERIPDCLKIDIGRDWLII